MRIVPINQILTELQDGEVVPSVRGLITEVYDPNSGQNDNGPWSFQNLKLKDQSGEIKVKLKDCEPVPKNMKGRTVVIACNDGPHGLTGVKASDDEYRGKTSRILWVTKSAHITLADEPQQQAAPAPQSKPATQTGGQAKPPPPRDMPPNGNGHHGPEPVKVRLNKLANLYLRCLDAGMYVAKTYEEHTQCPMPPEQFQTCVSSLFIQATRDGYHLEEQKGAYQK